MLQDGDAELRELAKTEIAELEPRREALEKQIRCS
jgi:protein subunit release factor A